VPKDLARRAVSDRGMAANTIRSRIFVMTKDLADQSLMARDAVIAENFAIAGPDANGFVKILQSEALGVPKPILGLGQVFADKIMRRVAVIARRNGMMTGFLPAIVLVTHDMAVHAGFRVVA